MLYSCQIQPLFYRETTIIFENNGFKKIQLVNVLI